jgi:hypothetical protein
MITSDNISRIGSAGMLPLTIADIKLWKDGVRFPYAKIATGMTPSRESPSDLSAEEWDALIQNAWDWPHWPEPPAGTGCGCHLCRPNRRYR